MVVWCGMRDGDVQGGWGVVVCDEGGGVWGGMRDGDCEVVWGVVVCDEGGGVWGGMRDGGVRASNKWGNIWNGTREWGTLGVQPANVWGGGAYAVSRSIGWWHRIVVSWLWHHRTFWRSPAGLLGGMTRILQCGLPGPVDTPQTTLQVVGWWYVRWYEGWWCVWGGMRDGGVLRLSCRSTSRNASMLSPRTSRHSTNSWRENERKRSEE